MGLVKNRRSFWQLNTEFIISTMVIILAASFSFASAQNKKVNIMVLYTDPHSVKMFDAAVKYVKNNPALGYSTGEIWKVQSNGTDASKLITSLCKDIDAAYKKPAGQQPDIFVDFTRTGISSEAVKLITKMMAIPTISGSFGQEGDIQSWRDLTENAKNYLIQIAPPADMVPQAVRSIVSKQHLANAAFIFDKDYEMDHKKKSLFKNTGSKNNITKLGRSVPTIRKQIELIAGANFTNFFIAASPNEISGILTELDVGPYVSNEYAWYSMSMEPGFPNCNGCKTNVSLIHLMPIFSKRSNERWDFLKAEGICKTQRLMELFYFDLTMNAIATVAKMKKDGTWKAPPLRVCKDVEAMPDDYYNLPLFDAFKSPEISAKNLLGPFHSDKEKVMGKSHSNFQMSIYRLGFMKGEAKSVSAKPIGVWTTGFGEKELISELEREEARWNAHLGIRQCLEKMKQQFISLIIIKTIFFKFN